MKSNTMTTATPKKKQAMTHNNLSKVTDFIMLSQREFILNMSKELGRGNISFVQFFLLSYLCRLDEVTMTGISHKMGHSTAAATGLVDRLEKIGYVERIHASDDRRKVMVRITTKGIELIAKLRATLQNNVAEAMEESQSYNIDSFMTNYLGHEEKV